jgi:hypothetical protein
LRLTAENAKSAEAKKQEVRVKRRERTNRLTAENAKSAEKRKFRFNKLSGLCVLGGKK